MSELRMHSPFKFAIGQVVHHRRYDYRGVIVGRDPRCRASDEWYDKNQTQPDRAQPWYNVLQHLGRETYVAEGNLEPDATGEEVQHPHVRQFFPTFQNGRYFPQSRN